MDKINRLILTRDKESIIKLYPVLCISLISLILGFNTYISDAEQEGFSPTNNSTSILKTSCDFLVSKGSNYGSSSSPDWTYDWGTYWNRIMYSATWELDGTATEADVLTGKTFYSGLNDRTIKTGTIPSLLSFPIDYSNQQYVEYDDSISGDYQEEESEWVNTNSTPGSEVWYDTRTELYWARSQPTNLTNSFSSPSTGYCDFFNTGTYPTRGSYGTSSTDPDCGNAINACAVLSLASQEGESEDTDWYLPSQKELHRAYVDGIYNQTNSAFSPFNKYYWSSTESSSLSTYAFITYLNTGSMTHFGKTNGTAVRCVRRD